MKNLRDYGWYYFAFGHHDDPRYEYYYDSQDQLFNESGTLIGSGPYMDLTTGNYLSGKYTLVVSNDLCYFGDSTGTNRLSTTIDLRQEDPDPPRLTSFHVRNSRAA